MQTKSTLVLIIVDHVFRCSSVIVVETIMLSIQMCVQFDRSNRGKSDSICGLEEVLSNLTPSVFVDEQLSKYKVRQDEEISWQL
jgi:hypothetical protein